MTLPDRPVATDSSARLAWIDQARHQAFDEGHVSVGLSPLIERSWQRCLALGLNPRDKVVFDPVSPSRIKQALDKSQSLISASQPVIQTLTRALLHTRYFALLTDADGVVLDVQGALDAQNPAARAIARVGVDLSEQRVGTTAIGACLADAEPIWLHRGEHFFDDNQVFSCAGAPIRGPQGHVLGMLDLTGVSVPEQPALKHLVTQAARSIENALTLASPHALLLRINWPGRLLGEDDDGLLCLDESGLTVGYNRPAAMMLELSPQGPLPHVSDVLAVDTHQLFDRARRSEAPTEVPLWSGLRVQVHAQRPVAGHTQSSLHALPLRDMEAARIRKAVDDARGDVLAAARALGISRATIYRKLGKR